MTAMPPGFKALTVKDYFMGRDRDERFAAEVTEATVLNAHTTVARANELLYRFYTTRPKAEPRIVTSGWRPAALNAATPGASATSKHVIGAAIDLSDPDGELDDWIMEHPAVLHECNLYMEHPAATKGWCHLQTAAPKSGRRIFYP
jgi:hypothetical protein